MGVFGRMLETQALLFLYILLGIAMVKLNILKTEGRSSFIGLLNNITLPCMVLHAFEQDARPETLIAAGKVLLISTGWYLAMWGVSKLLWRGQSGQRRAVLEFATMFSNAGNAGLPVVSLVFGDQGVLYASFFLIPLRVLMWTVGLSLFVQEPDGKIRWKELLTNPNLLVVFIGIPMMLRGLHMPGVVSKMLSNVGAMTGPLSMMLIGASLAAAHPRDMLDREAWLLAALRLLILPLTAMGLLRLMGVEALIWHVAVTLIAMPAAANTAIISEMYGHDYTFAARCVVVSTVLSLFTVPALALLY